MTCTWCAEEVLPDEVIDQRSSLHQECLIRMVIGSAAHQQHQCSCYGGAGHDPEGMSLRDAARLAYDMFLNLQPAQEFIH